LQLEPGNAQDKGLEERQGKSHLMGGALVSAKPGQGRYLLQHEAIVLFFFSQAFDDTRHRLIVECAQVFDSATSEPSSLPSPSFGTDNVDAVNLNSLTEYST
jgi:hypothetical protein